MVEQSSFCLNFTELLRITIVSPVSDCGFGLPVAALVEVKVAAEEVML
jgi:hypothetical protein